jgi:hypothetical protein
MIFVTGLEMESGAVLYGVIGPQLLVHTLSGDRNVNRAAINTKLHSKERYERKMQGLFLIYSRVDFVVHANPK